MTATYSVEVIADLPDMIERTYGEPICTFLLYFASQVGPDDCLPETVFASVVDEDGERADMIALLPRMKFTDRLKNRHALARAFRENFEMRLPHFWPFCIFARYVDTLVFFKFVADYAEGTTTALQSDFHSVCASEFGIAMKRHYVWEEAHRRHFARVGQIEVPR